MKRQKRLMSSLMPCQLDGNSYSAQSSVLKGATMVAAAWGVFIWKEFRDSPNKTKTNTLLTVMFISFIVGLGFIILAKLLINGKNTCNR